MERMYQVGVVVKAEEEKVLMVAMHPPSRRDSHGLPFRDSDMWELPWAPLLPCQEMDNCHPIEDDDDDAASMEVQAALIHLGLKGLDVVSSIDRIKMQISSYWNSMKPWKYWKLMEEPDYSPEPPLSTLLFLTEVEAKDMILPVSATPATQWMSAQDAWDFLSGNGASEKRLGPLAAFVFSGQFPERLPLKYNLNIPSQEYPPGVLMVPMDSKTLKPFKKTNLVIIIASEPSQFDDKSNSVAARGDALIVDPGCHPAKAHAELTKIVSMLPGNLLIFLTHHHVDHTGGLPTVAKQNPHAVLIAHEATIRRMGKVTFPFTCISVVDGSKILIGGTELLVVAAPGHTDGHMALLHQPTKALIVGDHCVGQGSAVLDSEGGGNMQDYLETTHRFLHLSPRMIVPMHGHFNIWPIHMLCGYIRHREAREAKILEAVENGAQCAFEIVSDVYADTPPSLWPAALLNVKMHVEHLAYLQRLPKDFSMDTFKGSCGIHFRRRYLPLMIRQGFSSNTLTKSLHLPTLGKTALILLISTILFSWVKRKMI